MIFFLDSKNVSVFRGDLLYPPKTGMFLEVTFLDSKNRYVFRGDFLYPPKTGLFLEAGVFGIQKLGRFWIRIILESKNSFVFRTLEKKISINRSRLDTKNAFWVVFSAFCVFSIPLFCVFSAFCVFRPFLRSVWVLLIFRSF